jgi:hypothetical protein
MSKQIPKVDFSWRSSYFQALQLAQCFDIDPITPKTAAILSLLYLEHDLKASRENLKNWLYEYILPFALNPIRDEQNLTEKTLAIAVFILLSKNETKILPDEQLINYIEYAQKQSWLNDSFLAFYCHFLKDQLTSCENVSDYFKANYELFLQKRHVPAISQSLIVLKNDLSITDYQRGYNILIELLGKDELPIKHWPWALWAFSMQPKLYDSSLEKLTSILDNETTKLLSDIQRENGLAAIFTLILAGTSEYHIDNYAKNLGKVSGNGVEILQNNDIYKLSIELKTKTKNPHLSFNDLSLTLLALHMAQYDKVAYVIGIQKDKITTLEYSLKSLSKGSIILSKFEKNIANLLAIFFTFQLGLLALFIQMGFPTKIASISLNWESFLILGIWLDNLLTEIQAALSGKSSLAEVKNTLLSRLISKIISLFEKSKER